MSLYLKTELANHYASTALLFVGEVLDGKVDHRAGAHVDLGIFHFTSP